MRHSNADKGQRQTLIRELIQSQSIRGQKQITDYLESKGIVATQATVSRDLREMGVVKGEDASYQFQPTGKKSPILEVARQEGMISLRVIPGQALLLKKEIWNRFSHELFSILSDDDTVLLILKKGIDPSRLQNALEKW
ncbi:MULTISPECIES: hypothetical protein [unclassified Streptococcus]|uniref:hypothetical protein n=1 Tax=unclassified Streptococcus TaxID=2608887 RepID=UPI0010728D7F|nr:MULTISPECIES: hypothetical protein [unclassified Streptococcus]MBF0806019.1 hypothetical protein [Streptococcus sp. 19428wA2_WM07]TFU28423.1 hypothetical protein E4T71_04285 [Streptococcus sp. WM07]